MVSATHSVFFDFFRRKDGSMLRILKPAFLKWPAVLTVWKITGRFSILASAGVGFRKCLHLGQARGSNGLSVAQISSTCIWVRTEKFQNLHNT